jgi:hypothetical protein
MDEHSESALEKVPFAFLFAGGGGHARKRDRRDRKSSNRFYHLFRFLPLIPSIVPPARCGVLLRNLRGRLRDKGYLVDPHRFEIRMLVARLPVELAQSYPEISGVAFRR